MNDTVKKIMRDIVTLPQAPRFADSIITRAHSVAELMYQYYNVVGCQILNRDEVYLLGLSHVLGLEYGVVEEGSPEWILRHWADTCICSTGDMVSFKPDDKLAKYFEI